MSTLATNAGLSSFLPVILQDKRTAVLKHIAQSERLVAVRPASRLEVRPKPEMISIGIAELDALTGGIPRGYLTEICGTPSSGKTSVLLATIASATRREEACVLIDASDSFDPSSGEAASLNFNKLLWVRCGKSLSLAIDLQSSARLRKTKLSGLANDQRRTTNDEGFADDYKHRRKNQENRLEQVLKSTDLILQSGGFGLVALDLAGIPEKFVRRIPLASWFRFQRAVEHTKTALLVISEFPCAQTCAALVMKICNKPSAISRQCVREIFERTGIRGDEGLSLGGANEPNLGGPSEPDLVELDESSLMRKQAPEGGTNLAQRFSDGEASKRSSSPVGTAEFSFSHLPSEKPSHAQVLGEMQIEAKILRSRLVHNEDRKPMQSVKTSFSTQAVRAG